MDIRSETYYGIHPGIAFREKIFKPKECTIKDVAFKLGISERYLEQFLDGFLNLWVKFDSGKWISPMAKKMQEHYKVDAKVWVQLHINYYKRLGINVIEEQ